MAKDKIAKAFLAITKDKFTIDTVAEMIATKYLAEGDIVRLNGYYSAGDGANHIRIISKTNDGSGVQLANGLWGNLISHLSLGYLDLRWFGAKVGSGYTIPTEDSSEIFIKALNFTDTIFPITWIGNLYLGQPVITTKYIFLKGVSESTYKIVQWGEAKFFPKNATTLYVDNSVGVAFTLKGDGSANFSDTRLNIKNVTFKQIDTGKTSTLFRVTASGVPSRGWNIEGSVFLGFDKAINMAMVGNNYTGTGFISIRNCHFEKGNYALATEGVVPLMHMIFENNICEQGAKIRTLSGHVDGFIQFKNNLFEGQPDTFNITLGNGSLEFLGNYFETNTGNHIIGYSNDVASILFNKANVTFRDNFYGDGCTFKTKIHSKVKLNNIEECFPDNSLQVSDVYGCLPYVFKKLDKSLVLGKVVGGFLNKQINTSSISFSATTVPADIGSLKFIGTNSYRTFTLNNTISKNTKFMVVFKTISKSNDYKLNVEIGCTGGNSTINSVRNNSYSVFFAEYTNENPSDITSIYFNSKGEDFYVEDVTYLDINEGYIGVAASSDTQLISRLDTPYFTLKMQERGIYEDYVNYRDELCEYEKSQNVPEGVMNLNVVQPPVIPKEVEEYAKEYNLL